jgi:hypothetical protein
MKLLIANILLSSLLVSCNEKSSQQAPPSVNEITYYEVAGLKVKLPARPQSKSIQLPAQAMDLVESMVNYEIKEGTTTIAISHVVYKLPEANLDGSADGMIGQVKAQSGVTMFTSSKNHIVVSGLQGRSISMNYKRSGYAINQYGMVFVRGNESWQMQVIGAGEGNRQALENLKEVIFDSVELQ